jgi:ketosteroid isomerase-like protein
MAGAIGPRWLGYSRVMGNQPDDKADQTMAVTQSMMLPLDSGDANATMILTPDMIVNDASVIMGRTQIERALATIGLWHTAVNAGDVETLLAMCADDIEIIGPRGRGRGHDAIRDWMRRAGFSAVPRRWFAGGDGHVVVEQKAKWRDRDGQAEAVIASAFVVRDGKIRSHERFEELMTALTMYGLRDVHEVKRR